MAARVTKELAIKWLEENAPHIKLLEWKYNGNNSKFVDTNRNKEFEYYFVNLRKSLKVNPERLFSPSVEEMQERIKQVNLERYGVENPAQNKEVQEKTKQTNLKRYGTEYLFQNKKIQEKIKKTNLERYGDENPSRNDKIKEKKRQTVLKNFGVSWPSQSEKIQRKMKQTNLKRYGAENPSCNDKVKEKIKQTMVENGTIAIINGKTLKEIAAEKQCGYTTLQSCYKKYGEEAVMNFKKFMRQSQEYVTKIVKDLLPAHEVLVEHCSPWRTNRGMCQRFDIFIPDLKLAIEYHGEQHYESIDRFGGEKNLVKTQKLDSYKREMCKKSGIKLVEIKYDELKHNESDVELIKEKINA